MRSDQPCSSAIRLAIGQAEPEASLGARSVGLVEALEDAGHLRRRHADPGVADVQTVRSRTSRTDPPWWLNLIGVAQQIADELRDERFVALHASQLLAASQVTVTPAAAARSRCRASPQRPRLTHVDLVEFERGRVETREVEEAVDEQRAAVELSSRLRMPAS